MPDFTRIINLAYERILGRPADPGGLSNYDLMNSGLTEAGMHEARVLEVETALAFVRDSHFEAASSLSDERQAQPNGEVSDPPPPR